MNATQTEFVASQAGATQNALILEHLELHRGEWCGMPKLAEVGGCYAVHSRISDLRKQGHDISNMVVRKTKPGQSFYRLN